MSFIQSVHPTISIKDDRFIDCNEAFSANFGLNLVDLQHLLVSQCLFQDNALSKKLMLFQNFDDGDVAQSKVWLWKHRRGDIVPLLMDRTTLDDGSQVLSFKLLQHRALDPATGLPNGWAITLRADMFFKEKNNNNNLGYIIAKIDNYSTINFRYGFEVGNQYLVAITKLLQQALGEQWLIVRYSAAKFGLLHIGAAQDDPALFHHYIERCCQQLCEIVAMPVEIGNGIFVKKSFSIGANSCAAGYRDFNELDVATETAFINSKQYSRSYYTFAQASGIGGLLRQKILIDELPIAVEHDQINLVYQPLYRVNDQQIIGFESLSRWHHPTLGNVSPVEFIKICEDTGFNIEFDLYVLGKVCRQVVMWRQQFTQVPPIAVNFSVRTCESNGLANAVAQVLQQTRCPRHAINIEITETAEVIHQDDFFRNIDELKALGIELAVDDFGTGYSSLGLLQALASRVNKIKIDRDLIRNIETVPLNKVLFKLALEMAQTLNISALAEGIENETQLQLLKQYHCEYAQGYFLHKPVDSQQIERLLENSCAKH